MPTMTITPSNKIYSNFVKNPEIAKKVFESDIYKMETMSFSEIKNEKQKMNMNDYEEYLYNKISAMDIHSSQYNFAYQIHISDAGLKKMKNDSEYESYVLSNIKNSFDMNMPKSKGGIIRLTFTDNEGDFKREVIKKEDVEEKKVKEKNFWEKRAERQKKLDEEHEKKLKKEKILKERDEKSRMLEEYMQMRSKKVITKYDNTKVIEMVTDNSVNSKLDELLDFLG